MAVRFSCGRVRSTWLRRLMSLIFRLFTDCFRSVRCVSARVTAPSRLIGSGVGRRPIHRVDRRRPQRIVGAADNQPLERKLGGAQRGLGGHQLLTPVCLFGLRGHDVDGRQRADLDARLVVLHEPAREFVGVLRGFDRLDRVNQVPVGVTHIGLRRRGRRGQLDFVVLLADAVGLQRRARGVDPETAQQRLREAARQAGLELRVADVDGALGRLAAVRPADVVVAAALPQVLRDAGRPRLTLLDVGAEIPCVVTRGRSVVRVALVLDVRFRR